jgi:hypothetical protein
VTFVVDKVALGLSLSKHFDVFCQFSFHRLLHVHLLPEAGTTDPAVQWPSHNANSVSLVPMNFALKLSNINGRTGTWRLRVGSLFTELRRVLLTAH